MVHVPPLPEVRMSSAGPFGVSLTPLDFWPQLVQFYSPYNYCLTNLFFSSYLPFNVSSELLKVIIVQHNIGIWSAGGKCGMDTTLISLFYLFF